MLILDMFVLLALLGTVSALDPTQTFHFSRYPRVFRRNELVCQVCYGEFDCLSLDSGRCGYNAEATEVLKEEDEKPIVNDALKMRVDSMMYDLILEDSIKEYKDCVPIISSYTQCNKDNICTGCKTCDCDDRGRWNCSVIEKCSRKPLHIDHRVLGLVMDRLKVEYTLRSKRSNEASEESSTHSVYEDLARWMYVSKPIQVQIINDTTTEVPSTTSVIETFTIDQDRNNIAFEEILSNNDLAHFIQSSEKDIITMKADSNDSQNFLQFLKNIEEGHDISDSLQNTHLKIDLLDDLKMYFKEKKLNGKESSNSSKDQPNSINSIVIDTEDFDLDRHQLDVNSDTQSLIRNARHVNKTVTINSTSTFKNDTKNITQAQSKEELQHIVDVVSVLISNQRKEVDHLIYVKDNLLKLLKKSKFNSSSTNTVLKQDLGDNLKPDWKHDMLNFYLSNLNKDIKDILKDIYAIEKLRKRGVAPAAGRVSNIKPLLLVLSSYYLKNKKGNRQKDIAPTTHSVNINNTKHTTSALNIFLGDSTPNSEPKPQRRVFNTSSDHIYNVKLLKRALSRMLLIIDKDRLSTIAINALSPTTKHIFNRIVNKQYGNDFAAMAIRDSRLNLTKILSNLAQSWKEADVEIFKFHPADRLHNMKLLYFTLSRGIDRIKEALIWIKFGLSRRMNFIKDHTGKDMVDDATKMLTNIDKRVNYFALDTKKTLKLGPKIMKDKQTETVWHHIKNAFSKSKNGITQYFKGKFKPRSYIVDENVRKRVEEVNKQKFLDVMRRWQENFDEYQTRSKRSNYAKRMKSIIPKYLRGKVNSGLDAKGKNRARVENRGPYTTKQPTTSTKKYRHSTVKRHKTTKNKGWER